MIKKFIITMLTILSLNASRVLSEEPFSSITCNLNVLKNYLNIDVFEHRESIQATPYMKKVCKNLENSCCSNEEFNEVTESAKKNLQISLTNIATFTNTLNLIHSANQDQFDSLFEQSGSFQDEDESSEKQKQKQEFQEFIQEFKNNRQIYINDMNSVFDSILELSGGVNCALCTAQNHLYFRSDYEDDSGEYVNKMVVDANYCKPFFQFVVKRDFKKSIKILHSLLKFTKILSNVYSDDVIIHEIPEQHLDKTNEMIKQCSETEDLTHSHDCLEFCFSTLKFNEVGLSNYYPDIEKFIVYSIDFFGDQTYLKNMKASHDDLSTNELPDQTLSIDHALDFEKEQWGPGRVVSDDYFNFEHNNYTLRLEELKVYPDNEGWNLSAQGMRDWRSFIKYSGTLSIISIGLILINLF
jgi:hypothetical protein